MYNSIDRQISCIDTLIQFMKFIPIQADNFNQKIESKIKALVEKGLPEDLTNNYLENYWQNIKRGQAAIEQNIEQHDLPELMRILEILDNTRKH